MDTISYQRGVASQVAEAIESHGSNAFAVSEGTGIPRSTLNRRLTGVSPFTVAEVASIAAFLGVDVRTLLVVEGSAA